MAVEGINPNAQSVNFGEGEQKKSKHVLRNAILGGAVVGAPTYFFLKDPINAEKVMGLDTDKFQKTFKGVPEEKSKEISALVAESTKKETIDEAVKKVLGDKEVISVDDYLKKEKIESKEVLEKNLADANAKTEGLTTAHKNAEEALKKADEAGKKAAQETLDSAKKALDDNASEINKLSEHKAIVDGAKENKIAKTVIEAEKAKSLKAKTGVKINGKLAELGEALPKIKNVNKALKYGGIAAAVVGVLSLIFGGKKEAA